VQILFSVVPLVRSTQETVPQIASGQRILLIEEDKDTASVISMILEQAGFKVTVSYSGLQAMGLLQTELPDAVMMDLMLSDIDDESMAAFVRSLRSSQNPLPLLVMSSATGGYQRSKALGAGADEFLSKPVDVDEFIAALRRILPKFSNKSE
jgi:DNA-binding response OmpR family regulator